MVKAAVAAKEVEVSGQGLPFPVSGILVLPKGATAMLALAHGAGAGMRHSFMEALATALGEQGIATLRYQFPYMEKGSKRPDSPKLLTAAVAAAVKAAQAAAPKLPLFAGGKSMGGRMTTTASAEGLLGEVGLRGIVCFGFPLHPPKQPATTRAAHLTKVSVPTLFLQGTRDDLADAKLMKGVVAELPKKTFEMHELSGADHGFGVLKSSGRTNAEVLAEAVATTVRFVRERS